MDGRAANIASGAVAPIARPPSVFKIHMKASYKLSKSTRKFRICPQNPHQNLLFTPSTRLAAVSVLPLQTKILCPPLLMGTANWRGSEELRKATFKYIVDRGVGELLSPVFEWLGIDEWIKSKLNEMSTRLKQAVSGQTAVERTRKSLEDTRKFAEFHYQIKDVSDVIGIVSQTAQWRPEIFFIQLKNRFNIFARQINKTSDINEGRPEASASVMAEVVGLQDEICTLRELLMSEDLSRHVISIVGMAGSGKTTLAKKVYADDDDVKMHFKCRAFISLSKQYDIKTVLERMLIGCIMTSSHEETSSSHEEIKKLNVEELATKIRDYLREKRYLVVIDDIWSIEAREMLKLMLPDGMNRSRVILTTRIKKVALHADPSNLPLEMRLLNDTEGWELFMKIFKKEYPSAPCPPELDEKRRMILEKCGGLPLAISELGSCLSKDKTADAWGVNFFKNVNKSFEKCRETLALGYYDLPYYLRQCFLYLSIFPENYEIDSAKLIRLWIAEDFIPQRDNEIMEDVAEGYLEELIGRNWIQASSRRANESIDKCRIHNLLLDLAKYLARQAVFFKIPDVSYPRSFSISVKGQALHHPTLHLRSIVSFHNFDISQLEFGQAKSLRAVSQVYEPSGPRAKLNQSVKELVHLRYLELGASAILLSAIGDLKKLQTLILRPSYSPLPNVISNLDQLRHLEAIGDFVEGNLRVNNLTNLQTLCLMAGSWMEDGFGRLTNLRKLEIIGITNSYHKPLSNSIVKLKNLRSLSLRSWSHLPLFMPFTAHVHLYHMSLHGRIEKLPELPPNLVELTLEGSKLGQDAIYILEKLPHLKILRLRNGSYFPKKLICSSEGFPQLQLLELMHLPLEDWIAEEGAMPSLKTVDLYGMPNLKTPNFREGVRVNHY